MALTDDIVRGAVSNIQTNGPEHTVGSAVDAYKMVQDVRAQQQKMQEDKDKNEMDKANWVVSSVHNISKLGGNSQKIALDAFGKRMQQAYPGYNPDFIKMFKDDEDFRRNVAVEAANTISGGGINSLEKAKNVYDYVHMTGEDVNQTFEKIGQQRAMIQAGQMKAQGFIGRNDEQQNQNAASAGNAFEKDPVLKMSKVSNNSLKRGVSILTDPKAPVTAKTFNLAYNDFINAVAAGGVATEGKIHREMPDTFEQDWNEFKQKFGDNADMRKTPAGKALIGVLRQNIITVKHDLDEAISEQAVNLHNSYQHSTNQRVRSTVKDKLKAYAPQKHAEIYGGPMPAAEEAPAPAEETMQYQGATYKVVGGHWVKQ